MIKTGAIILLPEIVLSLLGIPGYGSIFIRLLNDFKNIFGNISTQSVEPINNAIMGIKILNIASWAIPIILLLYGGFLYFREYNIMS